MINRQSEDGPGLRNLVRSDTEEGVFWSGFWDIDLQDAQRLIGGMLYLYEAKSKPSRFGGEVLEVEQVQKIEFARPERVVFKVVARLEGRGVKWLGADHAMSSNGGILDV